LRSLYSRKPPALRYLPGSAGSSARPSRLSAVNQLVIGMRTVTCRCESFATWLTRRGRPALGPALGPRAAVLAPVAAISIACGGCGSDFVLRCRPSHASAARSPGLSVTAYAAGNTGSRPSSCRCRVLRNASVPWRNVNYINDLGAGPERPGEGVPGGRKIFCRRSSDSPATFSRAGISGEMDVALGVWALAAVLPNCLRQSRAAYVADVCS
jgi:hypothetical protein